MDIATTPQNPQGNPELADAAPTPKEPPVIRREDYKPHPWLVPTTALDFDLGLEKTRVKARLNLERNPAAEADQRLVLNGDGLTPLSVHVDGEAINDWRMEGPDLVLTLPGDKHTVDIVTEIDPSANTQLMGLYASNGMLCTQCEAEGFRRITFFPDRPDVLSTYSVRLEGDKGQFPILLCNGNKVDEGEAATGRHYAEWHDPWPKPSYLFALVAGDLVANSAPFTTRSGRVVECNIWVRKDDLSRTDHALASLHAAMKWDEETFGREYDLDLYNIVAVSDFNMGAMENKGLNVFNTKYVLADTDTATDADFDAIEGVIAHEYFHNWSGNRITCRDWFQLSLKEGFTVLRDQLFSQDMRGEAVKRIEDVRILRAAQFPEDAGPLAHPIRPDSYREISNFYTATVYNKGAEVIRMMRSMVGEERFRKGTDLYFERHDGEAATCEDFVKAIEDGAEIDLTNFRKWYSTAGTPVVRLRRESIPRGEEDWLHIEQFLRGKDGKEVPCDFTIPLRIKLFGEGVGDEEKLLILDSPTMTVPIDDRTDAISINRGFTAPVIIEGPVTKKELVTLAQKDDDPFARYEALQDLTVMRILGGVRGEFDESRGKTEYERDSTAGDRVSFQRSLERTFRSVIEDPDLDDAMRGELLSLPSETYLFERMASGDTKADPGAIHAEREALKKEDDKASRDRLETLEEELVGLEERSGELTARWQGEKEMLTGAHKVKEKLDAARQDLEVAKRAGDLTRAGELTYSVIPQLEQTLAHAEDASSKRMLKEEVSDNDIASVVSRWTGIPVDKMLEGERDKLLAMEDNLHKRVVGQDEAITAVANAVRRARAGLQDPNRPIGSFLFLGPTGVGKTELTKALAEFLFDDEHAMVRLDMSEFMEKHAVARLIGAPPGYVGYEEGGTLTEAVRRRPYQVVLFDEVEKAHPDVFNVLLQVLDDGRLTDGQGRTVDFRNTMIIMTSNLGADALAAMPDGMGVDSVREQVMEVVRASFRPEFLNRIDEVLLFTRLARESMKGIVDIQLGRLRQMLADRDIKLALDDAALAWLAETGYDPVYGARPLKRVIQRSLQNPLANRILEGRIKDGDVVIVSAVDGALVIDGETAANGDVAIEAAE